MKHVLFLIALLPIRMAGQAGVSENYHVFANETPLSITTDGSGGYLLSGVLFCDQGSSLGCSFLVRTDSLGKALFNIKYTRSPVLIELKAGLVDGDSIVFIGSQGLLDNSTIPLIVKMDLTGSVIWEKPLLGLNQKVGRDIIIDEENYYFISGGGIQNTAVITFLYKANKQGKIVWQRQIESPHAFSGGTNFERLPDGSFVIGMDSDTIPGPQPHFPSIAKTDSLGNVEWWTDLPLDGDFIGRPYTVRSLENGGFVINSDVDTFPIPLPYPGVYSVIYALNPNGERAWTHSFLDTTYKDISEMKIASNGDILGCGWVSESAARNPAWLFRMSEEGELKWEKRYTVPWSPWQTFMFYDLVEKQDGTIALIGQLKDTIPEENQDIWLLTVDSNGCFTPGCTGGEVVVSVQETSKGRKLREVFFEVRPNPASHILKMKFLHPVDRGKTGMDLTSVDGSTMLTKRVSKGAVYEEFDTSGLAPGIYTLQYKVGGFILQSEKIVVQR